jgi:V8-like Glu-specific endopeptidase
LIDHQVTVDFDSLGGDSGGPYYASTNGSYAAGIHTHSLDPEDETGWFSTLGYAKSAYKSHTGIDYVYCVTDSC